MNSEIQKLLAEIEDSNNKILDASNSRFAPSEEGLGDINNNSCDVSFFLNQLKILLTTK